MTEDEYMLASNMRIVRTMKSVRNDFAPDNEEDAEDMAKIGKSLSRIEERLHAKILKAMR